MTGFSDDLFGPMTEGRSPKEAAEALRRAAAERILVLDGAMGTEIQLLGLSEDDFRGHRFGACECHLQGNNDLLNLTQPQQIEDIHYAYAMAGADILETNTFSSTTVAQADYRMEDQVYELNRDGARLARRAALTGREDRRPAPLRRRRAGADQPHRLDLAGRQRPGFRAITFDELRVAYGEQLRGLIDGGSDLILIETIFDTLNAKAAVFACNEIFAEKGVTLPIMISGTITDLSGRTLSGQTPTAFWYSLRHAEPFTIGLNCALGAARCATTSPSFRASPTPSPAPIRMPACRTSLASTTRARRGWRRRSSRFAQDGLVNIVGGCCGSTPDAHQGGRGDGGEVSAAQGADASSGGCGCPASSRSR